MLKHQLIHPQINEALGRAGHHAKILIADGNYPASTKRGPNSELVCLNLAPGVKGRQNRRAPVPENLAALVQDDRAPPAC